MPHARDAFEQTLEVTRKWYGIYIAGYVVMPEHVHLLLTEPERAKLSVALQMLKSKTPPLRQAQGRLCRTRRDKGGAPGSVNSFHPMRVLS